jgi:hypothetical protein
MKLNLCLLVAVYLVVDLCLWHGPLDHWVKTRNDEARHVVVRVQGQVITEEDLDRAARETLFRRGEDWAKLDPAAQDKTRKEVLARMIDGVLIRAARLSEAVLPIPAKGADEELRLFIKQFPLDTDYPARLPLQQMTEVQLRAGMQAALDDQAWIEKQIEPRLAALNEASARTWYETHKEQLTVPESFHAVHLFLEGHEPKKPDREPEIRKWYRKITAGESSLESLIPTVSEDDRTKTLGGDLGWFTRERMPKDFMTAVVALKPGQLSKPVHTWLGWHLIRLLEKKPARVPSFDEVKDELLARLRNEQREAAVKELVERLRTEKAQ